MAFLLLHNYTDFINFNKLPVLQEAYFLFYYLLLTIEKLCDIIINYSK